MLLHAVYFWLREGLTSEDRAWFDAWLRSLRANEGALHGYIGDPAPTNLPLMKHGVGSCLEYANSFDLKRAHSKSNPDLAPHLGFIDL